MKSTRAKLALCCLIASLFGFASGAGAAELLEPCTGPHDWVRLVSSEWLKGDLRRMRNKTLEFKSKKLKIQNLKWKDVSEVCLPGVARYVRDDSTVLQGIGRMRDGEVMVLTAIGEVRFPRSELVAILPGRATELDRWSLLGSAGLDANVGNTQQAALNASLVVRRESGRTRLESGYYGSWGAANGAQNVNKHRLESRFDMYLTRYFYLTVPSATLSSDKFQNINLRASPGAGVGYQILDLGVFEWEVDLGVAYQYTSYISVEPGQPESLNDFAGIVGTTLKWDITNDLDVSLSHQSVLVATNFGASTNHTRIKLKYELTDLFNFEVTTVHDRVQQPVADSSGTVPKAHDLQFIVGISLELN